jgi:hypothetical protein
MTTVVEGHNSFFLASGARLLDENKECAWAEKVIQPNPGIRWVLGKFVEANKPNLNKQFWSLDHLRLAQPTINHAPMNMLHHAHNIVGTFVATEMMYPMNAGLTEEEQAAVEAAAAYEYENPYIEALGAFWKWLFPNELKVVEAAHNCGSLFFSMECIAKTITCAGEIGCGTEYAYAGPSSESYCEHLNSGDGVKQLNNPVFVGGALIFPPERPGWPGAEIKDLASMVKEHQVAAERAYEGVKADSDHLSPKEWEYVMGMLLAQAKKSKKVRKAY